MANPTKHTYSNESRPTNEPEALKTFLALNALFIVVSVTLSTAILGAYLYQSWPILKLHALVGESNPLTFGALLTGLVALSGLIFAIDRDRGDRFRFAEAKQLRGIVSLIIFFAGICNVIWEYMRAAMKISTYRLASETSAAGEKDHYRSLASIGAPRDIKIILDDGWVRAPVFLDKDMLLAWLSPSTLLLLLASSAAISLLFTATFVAQAQYFHIQDQSDRVQERIASREQAIAFLAALADQLEGYEVSLKKRSIPWAVVAKCVLLVAAAYGIRFVYRGSLLSRGFSPFTADAASSVLMGLIVLNALLLGFGLYHYRRYAWSLGLLVDRAKAYYYLGMMGITASAAILIGFAYELEVGMFLLAAAALQIGYSYDFVARVRKFQDNAINHDPKETSDAQESH